MSKTMKNSEINFLNRCLKYEISFQNLIANILD